MDSKCKFHPVKPSPRCRICNSQPLSVQEVPEVKQIELKKPEKKHGSVAVWGDKNTWNISSLMRKNVFLSSYFNNELFHMKDLREIIPEMNKHIKSFEPWIPGTCNTPTSLFCILIKLFMLKLTEGQLRFLMDNENPFIKVTAFLYIRFICDPSELWDRYSNYTVDPTIIDPSSNPMSISEFIEKILSDQNYYNLQLPRIPNHILALINSKIAQLPIRRQRFEKNNEKVYEKDQKIYVFLESPTIGIFKHRDGNKAHVQVDGKDHHVSIADVDDKLTCESLIYKEENNVLTSDKKLYVKRSLSYKNALMFQVPHKRERSPSPEEKTIEVAKKEAKTEVYSLETKNNSKVDDSLGTEYFKLG